jgi:hypothetical protein
VNLLGSVRGRRPVHVHVAGWVLAHVVRERADEVTYLVSARCQICHQVLVGIDADGNGVEVGGWRALADILDERRLAAEAVSAG